MFSTGVLRMQVFEKAGDYEAFERVLKETLEEAPMRVCAYCLMPGHWHILLWPERDGDLAGFMQRLTITHVQRWQESRHYVGLGHVYQGRYKSFPLEEDEHFLAVARYVERNALRANLVVRGRVALVESLEALSWNCGGQGGLGRVAVGGSGRLAGASQSRRQRERVGGATPQRPARAAVGRDGMAETDCQASRPGIGVPLAGSAGHRAAGRGGQRLVTAHVCLPLLPISDLSRFPFQLPAHGPLARALTLSARSSQWDSTANQAVYGAWSSVAFTYQAPAVASVVQLNLLNVTSTSPNTTSDPTLVGDLAGPGNTAYATVEFDYNNGTIEGYATTDADGNFTFTPAGLPNGAVTVRARVLQWDPLEAQYDTGTWTSTSFTYSAAPACRWA